jgi:geranylgeranyl pyrophosphate synthase
MVNHIQDLLIFQFRQLLDDVHSLLGQDIVRALELSHSLLTSLPAEQDLPSTPSGAWALSIVLLARYLNPDTEQAQTYTVRLAVVVECWMIALGYIDDLQDEDVTPVIQELGRARTQSVALALQLLAQKAILFTVSPEAIPDELQFHVAHMLLEKTLVAVGGQHRDMLVESYAANAISAEECLEITAAKSGALLTIVFDFAALVAEISEEVQRIIDALGPLLGIYHQLMNDCTDVLRADKSDLARSKKTLPIVLMNQYGNQKGLAAARSMTLLYRERALNQVASLETCLERPMPPLLRHVLGVTDVENLNL